MEAFWLEIICNRAPNSAIAHCHGTDVIRTWEGEGLPWHIYHVAPCMQWVVLEAEDIDIAWERPLGPSASASLHSSSLSLQCWWSLVTQTEALSQVLQRHAEALASGPLQKLNLLIRDKQQLRRSYSEQWEQMSQELTRTTQQEPERLRAQYRTCLRDSAQAKRKYREASKEKEREKAKDKYVRTLWKLYSLHNQYVLALKAAEVQHFAY
ncbi:hypothetical protein JRQ81_007724 [Phrynocephalus forsythii]|uniref:F-BAR domain-containing protein n=1 Tax=Phrynocephalus forsythii TaxID=171643 RepID=A0A9Q1ATJ5_9SAUR|nr:hypothetical protein JRQ81_007724 [Phrynocephalus forsythii]